MKDKDEQFTFMTPTMAAGLLILCAAYFFGKRVSDINGRVGRVEQEAEYSKRDRQARKDKRDFWVTKVFPLVATCAGVLVAVSAVVVTMGITFGWFK